MYVVAAIAEQAGPPPAMDGRPKWTTTTVEPVGTRHAAASSIGVQPRPLALCGSDLSGWVIFGDREFDPGSSANCQRCAQLVSAPRRPSGTDH
jgi:hypothetical protein